MAERHYWFCTLFDRNYLYRGLALYRSLERWAGTRFTLFVLCMDDVSHDALSALAQPRARLIRLADFEDAELLRAKGNRSPIEYYWTCTPSLPLHVLRAEPAADLVTYVDSDLYFYADPGPLFAEMGEASVMIHEHRFPPRLAHFAANGIYNVGWVSFRRDDRGLACARRWREQCIEWCYYRLEDGKLGDQKYLDTWPQDFAGVHVLQHKGGGLAPWNLERYDVRRGADGRIRVDEDPLVFFHFHGMRLFADGTVQRAPGTYSLRESDVELVYAPYELALRDVRAEVDRVVPGYTHGLEHRGRPSAKDTLMDALRDPGPAATLDRHAIIYTPAGPMRPGRGRQLPAVWRLARETWASRDMVMRLIGRDMNSRYRQFYLGAIWLVLSPAVTIAVFLALNRTGVLNVGAPPVPYPLFALIGITIWQFFANGVGQGTASLVSAGPLLIKVNVPKASLVIASFGTTAVDFAVRLAFVAIVYAAYGLHPPAAGLLAIFAFIPLVILTVALALIQSVLGVVVRDIAALLPTFLGVLVFLMPVYYETPTHAVFTRLNNWNPLYHLVCGPRDLLVRGYLPHPTGFLVSTLLVIALLALASRFFAGAQYKLAERA